MTKRRTREHVIADLSVNHFERYVLRAGHVADRVIYDYGYDLIVRTFDSEGSIEPDFFLVQLKASDAWEYVEGGRFVTVRLEARDNTAWRAERVPVILVAYDAAADIAYWLDFKSTADEGRASIRIPTEHQLEEDAIQTMRLLKNGIL